jgi:crotonobetainyl-CoA hydratase
LPRTELVSNFSDGKAEMSEVAARIERYDHTMVITINRPEARNAVNSEVANLVGDAIEEANEDSSVWVVVITGAGDRAFCAGADLKALSRGEDVLGDRPQWGFAGFTRHFINKPTIAAVNGLARGGGTEIVLASDLAVAAETASFGLPEVSRGILASAGGAFRIATASTPKRGLQLLLTGEPIDANTALDWGLVNSVVREGSAVQGAFDLAELICRNAPLAVQASKRIAHGAWNGTWTGEAEYWNMSSKESAVVRASRDGKEGPLAYAEKREPRSSGQ